MGDCIASLLWDSTIDTENILSIIPPNGILVPMVPLPGGFLDMLVQKLISKLSW